MNIEPSQKEICDSVGVEPAPCHTEDKLGIALSTLGELPINGLRHNPENGTSGWYIWCGEVLSEDAEFFESLHVSHIAQYLPEVQRYLALPPGHRFLLAPTQEEIWHDPSLTNT
jgi:hypothetical protein